MHQPPEQHLCKVCRRVLNATQIYVDDVLTETRWSHGYIIPGTPPHDPDPIVASAVNEEMVGVCDFCSEPGPRWRYPAKSFEGRLATNLAYGSVDDWAACDKCHDLIEHNDWGGLADRYIQTEFSGLPRDDRRKARKQILAFHQQFRRARSGEAEAIY